MSDEKMLKKRYSRIIKFTIIYLIVIISIIIVLYFLGSPAFIFISILTFILNIIAIHLIAKEKGRSSIPLLLLSIGFFVGNPIILLVIAILSYTDLRRDAILLDIDNLPKAKKI